MHRRTGKNIMHKVPPPVHGESGFSASLAYPGAHTQEVDPDPGLLSHTSFSPHTTPQHGSRARE